MPVLLFRMGDRRSLAKINRCPNLCLLLLKQFRFDVPKAFELEGVSRRIGEEESALLAAETFETDVGLDDEFSDHPLEPRGECLPVVEPHNDPAMGNGHSVIIDWVEEGGHFPFRPEFGIEMGYKLVSEHIEIDPVVGAAAFRETKLFSVEFSSFVNVAHGDGDVEGCKAHRVKRVA